MSPDGQLHPPFPLVHRNEYALAQRTWYPASSISVMKPSKRSVVALWVSSMFAGSPPNEAVLVVM